MRNILAVIIFIVNLSVLGSGISLTDKNTASNINAITSQEAFADERSAIKSSWMGNWIGPPACKPNTWVCYRSKLFYSKEDKQCIARIACDSKYWLWVNGVMVVREGALKRGPTPDDSYFDAVDLAPYLVSGLNSIAILQWYFGKDGFSHKSSNKAALYFDISVGGGNFSNCRDWRMLINPAFRTASPEPNLRFSESSVLYDARLGIGEWMMPEYDDSKWDFPLELGKVGDMPWGQLVRRPVPLWKGNNLCEVEQIKRINLSEYVALLPYNCRFTPWIDVEGPAGSKIKFTTDTNMSGDSNRGICGEYILTTGRQQYELPTWLSGAECRLAIDPAIVLHAVKYRPHEYNTQRLGNFSCDIQEINILWEKSLRTLEINMLDSWSDCPNRERAAWIGDIVSTLEHAHSVYDTNVDMLTQKTFMEMAAWRRSSGVLYAPVPAGNWNGELPQQVLAASGEFGLWRLYELTNDPQFLRDVYPAFRQYVLEVWKLGGDGLAVNRKGDWEWGDWGESVDIRLLEQVWYYLALKGMGKCAEALNLLKDKELFYSRQIAMEAVFHKMFWTGVGYKSVHFCGGFDERANALVVLAGLSPHKNIMKGLFVGNKESASPYMEKYVIDALFALGEPEVAVARVCRRYSEMARSNSTTLYEIFPADGTNNHLWSCGPIGALVKGLSGISLPSYKNDYVTILPQVGALRSMNVEVPCAKGMIRLFLNNNEKRLQMNIAIPEGVEAEIGLPFPDENYRKVEFKSKENEAFDGVQSRGISSGYIRYFVKSGSWEITGWY